LIQDSLDSELIQYAKKGNLDMVLDLLHRGTNVNAKDNLLGKTALMCASENGNLEVVRALLNCEDVDVNIKDNNACTALDLAWKEENDDVARLLEGFSGLNF
jgi:ankyrin repeat protein